MAKDPRREPISEHIAAIAGRTTHDARRLTDALARGCWPRGDDGHRPAAADWLRRWGPARTVATLPVCGCAAGACAVCN
jgi:hypothetical protein